jgi:hypothetical protein
VHAGLFDTLLQQGWQITVMAKIIDDDLPDQFQESVELIPFMKVHPPFLIREVTRIIDKGFKLRRQRAGTALWKFGANKPENWRQKILFVLEDLAAFLISLTEFGMHLCSKAEKTLFNHMDRSAWRDYFNTHKTDAVLVNVPRQSYLDPLLVTAKEMEIKTFLVYHTAKDIYANGRLNHGFSGIGVWNKQMKKDLLGLNSWIAPENVRVVGCGHFDCVGRSDWYPEERRFRRLIGARLDSLLVIYTTAGPGIVPHEERYIELVVKAAKAAGSALSRKIQVVFRMNPMDHRAVLFENLKQSYPEHIVLRPDWVDVRKSNWTYAKKGDPFVYNALLHYASLCVTIPSTVTVDAALSDLPVINLGIEVAGEQPLAGSLSAFWETGFNKNVRETSAAKYVKTNNELITAMITYLKDRSLDSWRRHDLVQREVDGIQAGESSSLTFHMVDLLT